MRHLIHNRDKHGTVRTYVRRYKRTVRIKAPEGTPDFKREYQAALKRVDNFKPGAERKPRLGPAENTLGWLVLKYYKSAEFLKLNEQSQSTRKAVIEACLREPKKASPGTFADIQLSALTKEHVRVLRDRKQNKGLPGAATNRLKYLSAMFSWAVERGYLQYNPRREVKKLSRPSSGFRTWSLSDVRQYEKFYPVGTKQRLALALLLYTGVRRSDLVCLGKSNISGARISYVPNKTRHSKLVTVTIPLLPPLAEVLKASPVGKHTFLETGHGASFTRAGFGQRFREWCNAAGLPVCSAHGLRKLAATLSAEGGATVNELMSMFGWSSPHQALIYTRAADAKRLGGNAANKMLSQMITDNSHAFEAA
jgi:integrase